ncbi:tandem-95 repeat protein, partial [Mycobacterium hodleri]|uniref:Ig-like domain-containing protein n=1 Tax=Mycolicibacterium hodleri TaxID=49897 RepID=UPI0021F28304
MGCAKYVGRVGALAVALGIGTAVVTAPGIAWADDTGASSNDNPPQDGANPAGPNADTGSSDTSTPGAAQDGITDTGTATTTTTQQGSTTTTVGGGPSGPTVTFGSSSNTGSIGEATTEDSPPPLPPSTATTAPEAANPDPTVASPTTVVATPAPVPPTSTPSAPAVPVGAQDHDGAIATNGTAVATGSPTFAASTPAGHEAPPVFAARLATINAPESNALQDNTISALAVPVLPVPTAPQPTLADAVLALPGTIISTALNLISAALAPLIGPGAPADNPVLWGVLAFVRRQFNESFANSTPVLAPRQTSQDLDDDQVHGTFGGSDADGDVLAYTVPSTGTGAPAHGTVTVDQASGTYTYTPTAGYVGEDYFFVTATDATGASHVHALGQTHTAAARVDVTVAPSTTPVNHAPAAGNDSFTTDEDTAFSGSVLGNDSDSDGNALHTVPVTKATSAGGSVSIKADGTFTYTPKGNFNGTDTFAYTVEDGTGAANASALGTVTMTVNPVNDAPTLSVVTEETGAANGAVKVTLTYAEPEGDLTSGYIATPVHGGLYADAAGLVPVPTGVSSPPFPGSSTSVTQSVYYIPDPTRPGTETLS